MRTPRPWPKGLPTALELERGEESALPARFAGEDVRFSEALVRTFVDALSLPGDIVLDPFAGFGTTPAVAEAMGRQGWGIELDPKRAAFARGRLRVRERLIEGDARQLDRHPIPPIGLVVTSPPYSSPDEAAEALAAYRGANPGYAAYLDGIADVFRGVGERLTPDAWVVIEVSNLRERGRVTTLAWDVARAVGGVLPFAGELVVRWRPTYAYGYDHSYCLLFG
jgi:DNA modification methylase